MTVPTSEEFAALADQYTRSARVDCEDGRDSEICLTIAIALRAASRAGKKQLADRIMSYRTAEDGKQYETEPSLFDRQLASAIREHLGLED